MNDVMNLDTLRSTQKARHNPRSTRCQLVCVAQQREEPPRRLLTLLRSGCHICECLVDGVHMPRRELGSWSGEASLTVEIVNRLVGARDQSRTGQLECRNKAVAHFALCPSNLKRGQLCPKVRGFDQS
jgi:hypothetical protein